MTGDDAVELGERLDLVDDHLAHLRGALGGFLRHFENAAAQFGAGGFELAVHFGTPSASCRARSTANLSADCLNIASASRVPCW